MLQHRTSASRFTLLLGAVLTALVTHAVPGQHLVGRWQGEIRYDSLNINFPLVWNRHGKELTLSFFNGVTPITSTRVTQHGDSVLAEFAQLASELRGTLVNGQFVGTFGTPGRRNPIVTAKPGQIPTMHNTNVPNISGVWNLPTHSSKGEDAWRLVVTQRGGNVTATILRIDGDAGALVGQWNDNAFTLYHFDGTRPARLTIRPLADSALQVALTTGPRGNTTEFLALRPDVAKLRGLAAPSDFATFTTVRDLDEPFQFSFPDLNGQLVGNTDRRFRNKAIIVTIGGSWCPNCHDEAPFLAAIYQKYRKRGLEVVSLDFEEANQLQDLSRLKAFVEKFGIDYPVLIAGQTSEVHKALPQAVNLNTWPATFFIGRDGKVRAVRAGFAAPASGEFHAQLERDYTAIIEGLLREPGSDREPK